MGPMNAPQSQELRLKLFLVALLAIAVVRVGERHVGVVQFCRIPLRSEEPEPCGHRDSGSPIGTGSGCLAHLKGRGLSGVELIVSDARMGLVESAAEFFPEARWQRCMVHFYRNVFSHVPAGKLREVALMLKAIHAQEDLEAAQRKATDVVARLRNMKLAKAAELVETAVPETLAYYAFPEEHWRRIRTNNPLERIMREIRRRTRVVGAFPDGNSALNLAAARLRHIAGTRWSTKRYLNMQLLKQRNAMIA